MNNKKFTAVLQVALWRNDGMSELQIRQLLTDLVSNKTIKAGIKLHDYLNSLKIKWKYIKKIVRDVKNKQDKS